MNIDYDFIPECKKEIEEVVNTYLKRSLKASITNLILNLPSREDIFIMAMDALKTERKDIFYNKDPENYWKKKIINYKEVDKDPIKYFNDFIGKVIFSSRRKAKYFFKLVSSKNTYVIKISIIERINLSNPSGIQYGWFKSCLIDTLCKPAKWGNLSDFELYSFQPLKLSDDVITQFSTVYFESNKIKQLEKDKEVITLFLESEEFKNNNLITLKEYLNLKEVNKFYTFNFKVILFNNFKDIFPEVKYANLKKANKFFETPTSKTLIKVLKLDYSFESKSNHPCLEAITIKQKEECSPAIIFFRTRLIDLESKIDKISFIYERFLLKLLNDLNVPVNKTNLTKALNLIEISLF